MNNNNFEQGKKLLKQPILPLVSMIEFFLMTGPFTTVTEVIGELPETIETDYTLYNNPINLCNKHIETLQQFEKLKDGSLSIPDMVNEQGESVDVMTAGSKWIMQQLLTTELEKINSTLCTPCNCTLCCTGPETPMAQDFFEIPLTARETHFFDISKQDNQQSRNCRSMDEEPLLGEGVPFYLSETPKIFNWQNGWSMILPKGSSCPNLAPDSGRCHIYLDRPTVCRRPQIFPYIIEPLENQDETKPLYRIRNSLLGITDCPYVSSLKDEIANYAGACELELVLMQNKQ